MDLTDYINTLGGTATGILGALNKKQTTIVQQAAPAPAASGNSLTKFLPWIIGGVIGLVVLLLVVKK
jgi:hypothetical protein